MVTGQNEFDVIMLPSKYDSTMKPMPNFPEIIPESFQSHSFR